MKSDLAPRISVIIPHYNKYDLLKACLTSVMDQKADFRYEVIVVDDASPDGSVSKVGRDFPGVKVIALAGNCHFARACNEGLKRARGEYIALLNNDTEVDPGWLGALKQALDDHPEVGFCASRVLFLKDRSMIDSAGDCYTIAGTPHKIGHRRTAHKNHLEKRYVFGASASSSIYRRSMLEEIGLFDEDMHFALEDVDLSFRAQLMGYKCLYVPDALVFHAVSASIGAHSPQYVYYGQRNIEYVYFKNLPAKLLIRYLPLHVLYVLGAFLFYLKKGRLLSFLRAKADILSLIKPLLRKRRQIQAKKRVDPGYIDRILERGWFRTKLLKALRE